MDTILKAELGMIFGCVLTAVAIFGYSIFRDWREDRKDQLEWNRKQRAGEYVKKEFYEWQMDAQRSRHEEEINSAYWRIKGLEAEIDHLKRSKFIKSFMLLDENDNYVRDIREADKITGYDREVPEEYDTM
jgi:hypothetical protein